MLIGASGEKLGIVTLDQALESAKDSSLDLVQVSPPNADPVSDYNIKLKKIKGFIIDGDKTKITRPF